MLKLKEMEDNVLIEDFKKGKHHLLYWQECWLELL